MKRKAKKLTTKALSLLLVLTMLIGTFPAASLTALAAGVPDSLVTSLAQLYEGDEDRARADLEALYATGLLDDDGKLVDLDIREGGENVELDELAERITNGETVGEITVNGNEATPEQIVKISQVKAALEIAELLDEEIDVTDEHVENLESLLTGIQNGDVDLENALKTGSLRLNSVNNTALLGATEPTTTLTLTVDGKSYYGPYIKGSDYDSNYPFELPDPTIPNIANFIGGTYEGLDCGSATGTKYDTIDWANAKWGTDGNHKYQTVTVVLPLKAGADKGWISTEAGNCTTNGTPIEMELPDYDNKNIENYLPGAYFYDGNSKRKYPVYIVKEGEGASESAVALVARFAAKPEEFPAQVRMDTLYLYMNDTTEAEAENFPEWSTSTTDELGYHLLPNNTPTASQVSGVKFQYFVLPVSYFYPAPSSYTTVYKYNAPYVTRPSGWVDAPDDLGYIKLTTPIEGREDFLYVYPGDPKNPERQYDVEFMFTEDLYHALVNGYFYEDDYATGDLDLRVAALFSTRRDFWYTEDALAVGAEESDATYYNPFCWDSNVKDFYTFAKTEDHVRVVVPKKAGVDNWNNHKFSLYVRNYPTGFSVTGGTRVYEYNNENYYGWFTRLSPGQIIMKEGSAPYLMIPRSSRTRETLTGMDTNILFTSNAAQVNNANTDITLKLYGFDGDDIDNLTESGTPIYTTKGTSTVAKPLTSLTIPGDKLGTAGNYVAVLSTKAGDVDLSAKVLLTVKQRPVTITLNKLGSYYVGKDNIPTIGYSLTSAAENVQVKYTIQPSGGEVSAMQDASGGTIPFTADTVGTFEGLKKAYTITVYARNTEEDPWSVDSMMLTVYNNDLLKLILKDVPLGEVGGTTGGKAGGGSNEAETSLVLDNSSKISTLLNKLSSDANYSFDDLRSDIGLQEVISANYGSGTWGVISDKMKWSVKNSDGTESDAVTLNYAERGNYADLRSYSYTSYVPTSDFLIVATDDISGDAPVTVTATHANSGMTKSVTVTVNTLKNKLCLFRFNPKTTTKLYYTVGNDQKTATTNSKGELVLYEPNGITGDIVAMSTVGGETYIGTILNKDIASGEKNITKLELYPCNNLTLKPISSTTLTFLKPDGKPYSGDVTLRGGVYVDGAYSAGAHILTSNTDGSQSYLRQDMKVTTNAKGKATLWFAPSDFLPTSGGIQKLQYVFEYRFANTYQPGYVVIDAASNDPAGSIVNLQNLGGSATAPQIIRQDYQQYYWDAKTSAYRATDYTRNVIDYKDNIGISPDFSKAELFTEIALPGETVTAGNDNYSTYESTEAIKFAFYKTDGEAKLTGQTDISDSSVTATQITNLSQLDNATCFVFPFSAVPMLRSTYTMTNTDMTTDEIGGDNPTARIKAVFTKGDMTVRTITMPFGVTNVSQKTTLKDGTTGALAIGKEVRSELNSQTDIGSIFQSINVNDMIKKGFVFLGNLSGAGGYNPINMMILPTADPSTFRIIAFVGSNARESDASEDGVSVNFNTDDLAEDMNKYLKEMENDDDDDDDGGEGSMEFNFYGTIILEARVGNGNWSIEFRGGNVGTNVKGKYEWGQTFMCGPYPAFISFEVGFHADLEVAFGNKSAVRAMLLDAALGVSIEAFAGLGFDLSIVAIQLGIYGQIGADVNFLLLTPSNESAKTGTKLTISGEIGIKLKVKLLFISYTQKFASTGFNWIKKWNKYDKIKQYWTDQGFATLMGTTDSGRDYTMYLFEDGTTMVAIEGGAELENRDYLELSERAWKSGQTGIARLFSAGSTTDAITDVQTNSYPHSHPAFTDDGEMFLYISDNDNADKVESVASYAVKNDNGYANKERVDTSSDNVLADLDVVASGTKDNAFAAWVKQVETPKGVNTSSVTNDELSMMFNATEIYAGSYNGTDWTTTRLTDNSVADMAPTVASSSNKAIVAWRSMNASSMSADGTDVEDITAMFDVENNINYRIYDGSEWKTAQVAYNGNVGTVNAIDSAMLSDGTAILTYTVRTGEDVASTETFYTVIGADGNVITNGRLTNDSYTDTNAQVTAVNDESGKYFVLGWYSEHDAGEGSTVEYELDSEGKPVYDENGKAKIKETKNVVAHDIRLARINANGSCDIDFPESIGGTGDKGISSDFRFSAPANNSSIENVSVVWSQRKDSDKAEDAGKYELNAVRFFKADNVTGLTAPTDIAETDKNYTIDRFDTYTDNTGAIHAIILGSDYNNIQGIDKYDSIDLSTITEELGENDSNSDSPNNINILDGEAISSLKLATGTFPETAADVTADTNISEVIPGFTTPVQFTVTNKGTSVLDSVKTTVGSQEKEFTGLNLLPNQSATLLMSYNVPEGAVSDADYTVKNGDTELGKGTLTLNRPDVGISGIKLLQENEGMRDIQVMLANNSEIPLAGSGKTVKLAFYKDPFHEDKIGDDVSIPAADFADIDEGTYTTVHTIDVTDIAELNADGEIPDEGLTVYVRAWVENTEEPDIYNNDNYISFTGLLTRNNGEKLTTDTSVEVNTNESSEVTGYTVYADIRNNSMNETIVGTPVALLLSSTGEVIAQKPFQDESLSLTKEKSEELSVAFTADEIEEGKTPALAAVGTIYTVTFDLNEGSSTETIRPVQSNLEGHITLPETQPTPPTVEAGAEPLFFGGWYTAAEGGELITTDYTFTGDTTVYAHYVNHQHELTYTKGDTTITATCKNRDGFCYLPEDSGAHTHKATLTIAAPESKTYTGSAIPAVITDENAIQGSAKVLYATKGEDETYGEPVETEPVNVGTYQASITLGEGEDAQTVRVEYEIENAALTDVSVTQNGTLTYNSNAQTPQVTTAATAVNNQAVTFTYSLTQDGTYGEMPTFTNVADAGTVYYKASAPNHDVATGSFTVTMNKADQTVHAAPTLDTATANMIRLTEVDGCEYSMDGTTWQDSVTFTGLTKNTQYTFYQRLKGTANYNASPSSVAATISTTDHDHDWSFTASGATITATCGNSDGSHVGETTATMVINAPARTVYGGAESANATVTNNLGGIAAPTIVYKNGDTVLEAAPTAAGTYTASITLAAADIGQENDVTASVTYTIAKTNPTAQVPDSLTATYGQTLADVKLTNPSGNTDGTWAWVDDTTSVGDAGNKEFKANFTPTDTDNYNTVSNVDLTVNVAKAVNPATVTGTASVKKGGNTVDLANNITLNGATGEVRYAIDGNANGCTLSGSVLTTGTNTGTVTVNVTVAEETNYEALAATPITVTITDKDTQNITASNVTATYGDTDKSVSATTDGDGDISYAVKTGSEDYIEVNASTGALTIKKVPADGKAYVTVTAAETLTYAQATEEVTVTVSKRSVTLTSATDSKQYDGTPLTNDTVTVGGDGFANGEGAQYTVKGTITLVGTSENEFEYKLNDNTHADNYNITTNNGTLTVINRDAKYEITLKANSGEYTYDGTEKTVSGIETTEFVVDGNTYTVSGMTAEAKATNAGEYAVNVTGTPKVEDAEHNDVSEQFAVNVENGKLTIAKALPTVTELPTAGAITYGETLANSTLSGGEANADGKFTWADNTIKPTVADSDKAEYDVIFTPNDTVNYNTAAMKLTLTVNKAAVTVTTDAQSKTYGDTDPELTYTAVGLVGEDKLTGTLSREAGQDVGEYDITAGTLYVGDNYTLDFKGAKLTINAKDIAEAVISLEKDELVYAGSELTPNITKVMLGETELTADDYELDPTSETAATNSGEYTIKIKGKGNYIGEAEKTWRIAKATTITYNSETGATRVVSSDAIESAVLIFAEYDSEGVLVSAEVKNVSVAVNGAADTSYTVKSADNTLRVMLWDSLSGMKPLEFEYITIQRQSL